MNTPFDLSQHPLLSSIVDNLNVGLVVLDRKARVVLWNKFMQSYSGVSADTIAGQELFNFFPEIPKQWLLQKLHNVFILKNYSFTNWEERPYLFKFSHTRPITTKLEYMRQNCTFMPLKNAQGRTDFVCIAIFDVTRTSVHQETLLQSIHNLEETSHRDALTHTFNRRHLEDMLVRETSRSKRHQSPLSLIMLDLDHFKAINDQYGHLAGDTALVACTRQMQTQLRTSDVFARYGGEEFAIILPNTDLAGAEQLAQRLQQSLHTLQIEHPPHSFQLTASFGVSQFDSASMHSHDLIDQADQALYSAKTQGRNRICCHPCDLSAAEIQSEDDLVLSQREAPLGRLTLVHSSKTVEPETQLLQAVNQTTAFVPIAIPFMPEETDLPLAVPTPETDIELPEPDLPIAIEMVETKTSSLPDNNFSQTDEQTPELESNSDHVPQALVTFVTIGYK
ncbi:MAG: diguanylate cyclase [Gammaproteobacteria bacterium]|nr:diguanylate cyclase [Gammaproteobacteria bacterium]